MATVGQQLLNPESGWKRFDDIDSNITYTGTWTVGTDSKWYGGTYRISSGTLGAGFKFSFKGTKFRVIATIYISYSNDVIVKIDGVEEHITGYSGSIAYKALIYEKTGLADIEHYVEIINNTTSVISMDAIDINEGGELRPYNENLLFPKYLFQQGTNTYSIKTEFYDVGNYIPLTLEGGTIPNDNDFINNGIEDLNELLTTKNNGIVISGASDLGIGKFFSFNFKEDYKSIINIK